VRVERDGLYTVEELCEVFGVGRRTMLRWLSRGYLPSRRIGHKTIVIGADRLDHLPEMRPAKPVE